MYFRMDVHVLLSYIFDLNDLMLIAQEKEKNGETVEEFPGVPVFQVLTSFIP